MPKAPVRKKDMVKEEDGSVFYRDALIERVILMVQRCTTELRFPNLQHLAAEELEGIAQKLREELKRRDDAYDYFMT
jgi:hypothetical protein